MMFSMFEAKNELLTLYELAKMTKKSFMQIKPSQGIVYTSDETLSSVTKIRYDYLNNYPHLMALGIESLSFSINEFTAFLKSFPAFLNDPTFVIGRYGIELEMAGLILETNYKVDHYMNGMITRLHHYLATHTRVTEVEFPRWDDPGMMECFGMKKDDGSRVHHLVTGSKKNDTVYHATLFGNMLPITAKSQAWWYNIYDSEDSHDYMMVYSIYKPPVKGFSERGNIEIKFYFKYLKC